MAQKRQKNQLERAFEQIKKRQAGAVKKALKASANQIMKEAKAQPKVKAQRSRKIKCPWCGGTKVSDFPQLRAKTTELQQRNTILTAGLELKCELLRHLGIDPLMSHKEEGVWKVVFTPLPPTIEVSTFEHPIRNMGPYTKEFPR